MRVLFDNVDFNSNSGPNGFGTKLAREFIKLGIDLDIPQSAQTAPDVQLAFIQHSRKIAPLVLRLDQIYYNSKEDWKSLNAPIEASYREADTVIFQGDFGKDVVEHYFGKHPNSHIVSNGTDLEALQAIPVLNDAALDRFENVWSCASSWRPHKRLKENIRYFQEFSGSKDCLIITGENPDVIPSDPRIFYVGHLDWEPLVSVMKRSKYFLHLAFLDCCPNVVVDARACGCHIIATTSGGVAKIAGKNSTIIQDWEWDFKPLELYADRPLDFSKQVPSTEGKDIDMRNSAKQYAEILSSTATLTDW